MFSLPWLRFSYRDWCFPYPDWGFPYPDWGFSTVTDVFPTLTEVFLPWLMFSLPWLRFFYRNWCFPYPDWGFSTVTDVFPTLTEVFPTLTEVFLPWLMFSLPWLRFFYPDWGFSTLTEVFPCFFLSCKANARVKLAKTGHGTHSSQIVVLFYVLFVLCRSVYCFCVYMCTVLLPPGVNSVAANKCTISMPFLYLRSITTSHPIRKDLTFTYTFLSTPSPPQVGYHKLMSNLHKKLCTNCERDIYLHGQHTSKIPFKVQWQILTIPISDYS